MALLADRMLVAGIMNKRQERNRKEGKGREEERGGEERRAVCKTTEDAIESSYMFRDRTLA